MAECRDAEIGDLRCPVAVDHHVRRLEVAVQKTNLMRGSDPGAEVPGNAQRFLVRQSTDLAKERGKIHTLDKFHGDAVPLIDLHDVVETTNIRMRDLTPVAQLAEEPLQCSRI